MRPTPCSPPSSCYSSCRRRRSPPAASSVASERRERATRTERAGEAASERACRGVRGASPSVNEASITIDAAKVENRISPRLYGQFAEFMFENIKFGLHAELLAQPRVRRDRERHRAPPLLGTLSRRPQRRRDPLRVGRRGRLPGAGADAGAASLAAHRRVGTRRPRSRRSIRRRVPVRAGSSTAARCGSAARTSPGA